MAAAVSQPACTSTQTTKPAGTSASTATASAVATNTGCAAWRRCRTRRVRAVSFAVLLAASVMLPPRGGFAPVEELTWVISFQ